VSRVEVPPSNGEGPASSHRPPGIALDLHRLLYGHAAEEFEKVMRRIRAILANGMADI